MIYPCIVFRCGKWYEAGEDVPENGASEPVGEVVEKVEEVTEVAEEPIAEPQYTIKQVNKMKADEVKALAVEIGFEKDAVDELTATELKRNIITFLKLK